MFQFRANSDLEMPFRPPKRPLAHHTVEFALFPETTMCQRGPNKMVTSKIKF